MISLWFIELTSRRTRWTAWHGSKRISESGRYLSVRWLLEWMESEIHLVVDVNIEKVGHVHIESSTVKDCVILFIYCYYSTLIPFFWLSTQLFSLIELIQVYFHHWKCRNNILQGKTMFIFKYTWPWDMSPRSDRIQASYRLKN